MVLALLPLQPALRSLPRFHLPHHRLSDLAPHRDGPSLRNYDRRNNVCLLFKGERIPAQGAHAPIWT